MVIFIIQQKREEGMVAVYFTPKDQYATIKDPFSLKETGSSFKGIRKRKEKSILGDFTIVGIFLKRYGKD